MDDKSLIQAVIILALGVAVVVLLMDRSEGEKVEVSGGAENGSQPGTV